MPFEGSGLASLGLEELEREKASLGPFSSFRGDFLHKGSSLIRASLGSRALVGCSMLSPV